MRVLVCGGRDFTDRKLFNKVMRPFRKSATLIIEGECHTPDNPDKMARRWAENHGIEVLAMPAEWNKYGKSAGYRRNKRMLDKGKPQFGIAFPGGAGTDNMVKLMRSAGIPVVRVEP